MKILPNEVAQDDRCGSLWNTIDEQAQAVLDQEDVICSEEWANFLLAKRLSPLYSDSSASAYKLTEDELERVAQIKRNQDAIALLNNWLKEDPAYDKQNWPKIKKSMEKNRISDRKLFDDD